MFLIVCCMLLLCLCLPVSSCPLHYNHLFFSLDIILYPPATDRSVFLHSTWIVAHTEKIMFSPEKLWDLAASRWQASHGNVAWVLKCHSRERQGPATSVVPMGLQWDVGNNLQLNQCWHFCDQFISLYCGMDRLLHVDKQTLPSSDMLMCVFLSCPTSLLLFYPSPCFCHIQLCHSCMG